MAEKIQNQALNALRKSHQVVTIFLMNGFQMKGTIQGFDEFCVIFNQTGGADNIIYKHAISTISVGTTLESIEKGLKKD